MPKTAADKIWDAHVVTTDNAGRDLLYIDMHLLHEANTPVAFDNLRAKGRTVRRPQLTLGTEDHVTPTINVTRDLRGTVAERYVGHMRRNCEEFGIELYSLGHESRGIVHVIGPELGLSQPGMTMSAAILTPLLTAPSVPWPAESARARWSMSWPPRHCL